MRKAKSDDCEKKKTGASGGTGGNFSHALGEQLLASAPGRLGAIGFALTLGWPAYLLFNASGRPTFPKGAWPNHFAPSSPIFTSKREKVEVAVSDAALAVVAVGLFFLGKNFGFDTLFYLYFVPYLVVNAWLVTITLLQHTHPALPHYYTESWDWLRGVCERERVFFLFGFFFQRRGRRAVEKIKLRKKGSPDLAFFSVSSPRGKTTQAPSPRSTATMAGSSTGPTTTSRTPTSCTTSSARSRTTMPRRPPRPSSRSWGPTTPETPAAAS